MSNSDLQEIREDVACPFCSLGCDDLRVAVRNNQVEVLSGGCPISIPMFAQQRIPAGPDEALVRGTPASTEAAIAAAAQLFRSAAAPLIGGLGTDMAGMRAALALADQTGAVIDHMHSATAFRNIRVMQDSGWIVTTLSEVRNRADVIVLLGGDLLARYPRLFDRCIDVTETLFSAHLEREVIGIGQFGPALRQRLNTVIECPVENLWEIISALRSLLTGKPLQPQQVAGVTAAQLHALVEKLRLARYGVVAWSAADFDFANADLSIQGICALIAELNKTTRCAGLPLAAPDGEVTTRQVITWQSGYPGRVSFRQGYPKYDPYRFTTEQLLARGEADLLLWISSFDAARLPPDTEVPRILLGCAGMAAAGADVFIPVATPGVDQRAQLFRTDQVVAFPVRPLVHTGRPAVADILAAIARAI